MVVGEFTQETDLVVIGGGPGGYSAAFRAAELGVSTIVVDPRGMLGGVCLHQGCIPSKTLLGISEIRQMANSAARLGLRFDPPKIDCDMVRTWTQDAIDTLTKGLSGLARKHNIEVIPGTARFDDGRQLSIHNGSNSRVRFKRAIIATGSNFGATSDMWPDSPRVMNPNRALQLDDVPATVLVVGGDYIALELATIYAGLGSAVTLVTSATRILQPADADLIRPLARNLDSVLDELRVGITVESVNEINDGLCVRFAGKTPPARDRFDAAIVADPLMPSIAKLDLDKAQVNLDGGYIQVDQQLRTSNPRIFAVGDVAGEPMLADKAIHQGRIAAEVAAGWDSVFDARAVPHIVFTDPQVAWCGLTETQAKVEGISVEVSKIPWGASGRAIGLGRPDGLTKLIVDPDTKLILGMGIVGVNAVEMIGQGVLAIEMGAEVSDLSATIFPHPTISELIGEAASRLEPGP